MLPRRSAIYLALLALITLFLVAPVVLRIQPIQSIRCSGEKILYRIALRYGVSMDAIAQANNITNQSRISAGQQLTIPNFDPTPATSRKSNGSRHTSQTSDNRWRNPRQYCQSVRDDG